MKILIVFGTRPEAIKMAPIVLELQKHPEIITQICVTGQHREMLDGVLNIFGIVPDYDLKVMKVGQDLFDLTSSILVGIRSVLSCSQPDIVLVHGDTTTTFAASLAAFYLRIPVGHVEAGLRTKNLYSPWPEEANRTLTSKIATYHFSPTQENEANLIAEGVPVQNIFVTGNTVIDALHYVLNQLLNNVDRLAVVEKYLAAAGYTLSDRKMVLITGHRRENFGQGFRQIFSAIRMLAELFPTVDFVYPVHLNPQVKGPAHSILETISNVYLMRPVEYEAFVYLMSRSQFIITDSGGIQEEAPSLGKPVLVTREATERPEGVQTGTVKLVGTDPETIVNTARTLLEQSEVYAFMSKSHNPYGDGHASERIVAHLLTQLAYARPSEVVNVIGL